MSILQQASDNRAASLQVTKEVSAHLDEAGVAVRNYDAMLEDVSKMAADGLSLWADPAKVSHQISSGGC